MAIITKITTQKQSSERFIIFLDKGQGEEYGFSVDQDILIKYNLRKGLEIDELDFTQIQLEDEQKKAYNKAIAYLAYRMRSEQEIAEYLSKQDFEATISKDVIHKLKEFSYLDDKEFAYAYVRTHKASGKGPKQIERELKQKGIAEQYIISSLQEYPEIEQIETARKHAEKIIGKSSSLSNKQTELKIQQALQRKGFTWDIVSSVLNDLLQEDENDEWHAIVKQGDKLKNKYRNCDGYEYQQKMKQALYRKGFTIDLIERYLHNNDE
ncbi:recombination regulator RecX [Bacillus sp. HMF5848]|uniref:recombination regulator RecX n=1 Tax=Bacillus sp. HMF5848 TaxID=2495421 RepID=UPI000F76B186|nr:recombination regulator RecX [Bacillus sp. HMF5848]RSK26143.1 recombination regulator RecX [Bacillus sp. HMF5848]